MKDIMNQAPASIAAVLGNKAGKTDRLGKSGAQVLLFDDYVLKIRPADGWDTADVNMPYTLVKAVYSPIVNVCFFLTTV